MLQLREEEVWSLLAALTLQHLPGRSLLGGVQGQQALVLEAKVSRPSWLRTLPGRERGPRSRARLRSGLVSSNLSIRSTSACSSLSVRNTCLYKPACRYHSVTQPHRDHLALGCSSIAAWQLGLPPPIGLIELCLYVQCHTICLAAFISCTLWVCWTRRGLKCRARSSTFHSAVLQCTVQYMN